MSSEKKPFLVFEFLASRNPIEKEEDYDYDFLWSGGRIPAGASTAVFVDSCRTDKWLKYQRYTSVCLSPLSITDDGQTKSRLFLNKTDRRICGTP
jgi:hypothetical protein